MFACLARNTTHRLRILTRQFSIGEHQTRCVALHLNPDGVAIITLQRAASRNALGYELVDQLREAIQSVRRSTTTRAVVLQSSVDRVFCAGADLKERAKMTPDEVEAFVDTLRATVNELYSIPQPSIAVIDGAAFGGGLELALACDMRVAGANAKMGLVETQLGIIPGGGGTQLLPRLIGVARAKELIFTGKRLDARSAAELGIVNYTVESISSYECAMTLVKQILKGAPIAMQSAKMAIDAGSQMSLTNAMQIEKFCYARVINTYDRVEGLKAFADKREPVYEGR